MVLPAIGRSNVLFLSAFEPGFNCQARQKMQRNFGGPAVMTANSFRPVALRRRLSPVLPLSPDQVHHSLIVKMYSCSISKAHTDNMTTGNIQSYLNCGYLTKVEGVSRKFFLFDGYWFQFCHLSSSGNSVKNILVNQGNNISFS